MGASFIFCSLCCVGLSSTSFVCFFSSLLLVSHLPSLFFLRGMDVLSLPPFLLLLLLLLLLHFSRLSYIFQFLARLSPFSLPTLTPIQCCLTLEVMEALSSENSIPFICSMKCHVWRTNMWIVWSCPVQYSKLWTATLTLTSQETDDDKDMQ